MSIHRSSKHVQFSFREGEGVLCFEPDPTKARVLYESRILECCVGRNSRGKRSPEYKIHFQGWSRSWDRNVTERLLLPNNSSNRRLMRQLKEVAKNLRKHRRKKHAAIWTILEKRGILQLESPIGSDAEEEDESDYEDDDDDDDDEEEEDEEEEEEVRGWRFRSKRKRYVEADQEDSRHRKRHRLEKTQRHQPRLDFRTSSHRHTEGRVPHYRSSRNRVGKTAGEIRHGHTHAHRHAQSRASRHFRREEATPTSMPVLARPPPEGRPRGPGRPRKIVPLPDDASEVSSSVSGSHATEEENLDSSCREESSSATGTDEIHVEGDDQRRDDAQNISEDDVASLGVEPPSLRPVPPIALPLPLFLVLTETQGKIMTENELVKLPIDPNINVATLLEEYVHHFTCNLLCHPKWNREYRHVAASNGYGCGSEAQASAAGGAVAAEKARPGGLLPKVSPASSINLCKEVVDGLRIMFDTYLGPILLYEQEIAQFKKLMTFHKPLVPKKVLFPGPVIMPSRLRSQTRAAVVSGQAPDLDGVGGDVAAPDPPFSDRRRRRTNEEAAPAEDATSNTAPDDDATGTTAPADDATANTAPDDDANVTIITTTAATAATAPTVPTAATNEEKVTPDKDKPTPDEEKPTEVSATSSSSSEDVKEEQEEGGGAKEEQEEGAATAKEEREEGAAAKEEREQDAADEKGADKENECGPEGACASEGQESEAGVWHSSYDGSTDGGSSQPFSLHSESRPSRDTLSDQLLDKIESWRLLPEDVCQKFPNTPCLLYGARHFLRLFVHLPRLLARMTDLGTNKLNTMLFHAEGILDYLHDNADVFLPLDDFGTARAVTDELFSSGLKNKFVDK